ncbi:DUF6970 domain-containing protein [Hymenobacter puniceus]|uniref:DUF6970 domain-containing protein n=1 Tax=Hymenobacter sp. BT190 TaxID=2763505 RepID=UPI001C9D76AB|nr:hypothetical protein [Hymenobacter sp. BT190]
MRSFLLLPATALGVLLCGFGCQKSVSVTTPTDTPASGTTGITSAPSPTAKNTTTPVPDTPIAQFDTTARPGWLKARIEAHLAENKQNPPIQVFRYRYKGAVVYYETSPCCDQYTNLYDQKGKLICHPDGGLTGRGDGNCTDFNKNKTEEKLVWQDPR